MWSCGVCGLAQLYGDADGTAELAGVEPRSVTEQSDRSVARLEAEGLAGPGRTVTEFGSPHGGSWLPRLAATGMQPVPAASAEQAGGSADLVVDYYGLLHEPDQHESLRRRVASLAPGGTLAVQMLTLGTVLGLGQWFDLRHGHYAYWSLPSLDAALRRHGIGVHRVWWYPHAGGTVLVTAQRDPRPDPVTLRLVDGERAAGVEDPTALRTLQLAADLGAGELRRWLRRERDAGHVVVGYGAASRAVPVVCHAGLDRALLAMVGDASPAKHGHRMPGTDIPIVPPAEIEATRPDRVLLFLPELADEVRRSLPGVESAGGRWVVLTPGPRTLEPAAVV